jgi:hypothetical protein
LTNLAEGRGPWGFVKSSLLFVAYQIAATEGVAVAAYYLLYSTADIAALFGRKPNFKPVYWILTETPFYPVQILLGFYSGWMLARIFKHRLGAWVWVLPTASLVCAVVFFPRMTSARSVMEESVGPLRYYFGWGCLPKTGCLDQLWTTMPAYAAIAFSLGAPVGLRFPTEREAIG